MGISLGVSHTAAPWQQAVGTPTFQQWSTIWEMRGLVFFGSPCVRQYFFGGCLFKSTTYLPEKDFRLSGGSQEAVYADLEAGSPRLDNAC